MKKIYTLLLFVFSLLYLHAQVPTGLPAAAQAKAQQAGPSIAWQRCYGGSNVDYFVDAIKTMDIGFLASIQTSSTDGDLEGQMLFPGWVIKFDSIFNIQWQKFYNTESCASSFSKIIQIHNGNYILAGSGEGEECFGYEGGDGDFSLMEIDLSGDIVWQQLHGSPGGDGIESIIQTQDGGFLITGTSNSSGGDIPFHYEGGMGTTDAVIFKTDSIGNLQWLKNLGGSGYDGPAGDPVEFTRGFYFISIASTSNDYDLSSSGIIGGKRWILEMDSLGNITKENFISPNDMTNSDGSTTKINQYVNPIGTGKAESILFPAPAGHSMEEGAIAFFDTVTLQLSDIKMWGGSGFDALRRFCRDENGNYYFLGFSKSTDYDLPGNNNLGEASDYWLMATDSNFNLLWSRNFGGSDDCGDLGCANFNGNIVYSNNMLYVFIKNTTTNLPDHDIQCGHPGSDQIYTDAWIVAFDLTTSIIETSAENTLYSIYPNPSNGSIIIKPSNLLQKEITINLIDIFGRTVFSNTLTETTEIIITASNITAGLYTIQITRDNLLLQAAEIVIQ